MYNLPLTDFNFRGEKYSFREGPACDTDGKVNPTDRFGLSLALLCLWPDALVLIAVEATGLVLAAETIGLFVADEPAVGGELVRLEEPFPAL